MSDVLLTSRQGRLLRLALNRPEKRNALNAELCRALVAAVEDAGRDPAVGVVLLTGEGKSFCAGMDLAEIGNTRTSELNRYHEELFTLGARSTKPLIAAVRGAALGGGTGLVANCHIAIAGQDATFGLTEIRLGLWPFVIYRAVTAALGDRRALELALTGRVFDAGEAQEAGLVHEVVEDPESRAAEVAQAVASSSPVAIRSGMTFVHETKGKDGETAGQIARRFRDELLSGRDFQEGVRAFLERRRPKWPSIE